MNDPIVVTRTLVKRAWADVEPKLQWAFASGTAASFLLELARAYGVSLPPIVVQELPFILAILAGYIMPSVGQTVTTTKRLNNIVAQETESHTGNAVTVMTGPTPVQSTAPVKRASFTDVVENTPIARDEQKTEVMPNGDAPFWSGVRNTTGPQSIDGH